jgi:hypothetical protein
VAAEPKMVALTRGATGPPSSRKTSAMVAGQRSMQGPNEARDGWPSEHLDAVIPRLVWRQWDLTGFGIEVILECASNGKFLS